ncbi:hypothetical protein [Ideonella sp.]|uniref:hypothetical protein n=1 Tax=Ideonella sp. TaxID=1929293 RepID=UPI002B46B989|nr:hypothetical protein [Ideonella sp.]HJV70113.1 hypothetical protein [Ideonella sp.]
MAMLRSISITTLVVTLVACAQTPVDRTTARPMAAAASAPMAMPDRMAQMEAHMKAMREMHDRMARAGTPEERQALMAEQMKMMQDGMAMMGGMGPGSMRMGMGMGGPQMMEMRMDMMQSMMQMMMDRMQPPTPATK